MPEDLKTLIDQFNTAAADMDAALDLLSAAFEQSKTASQGLFDVARSCRVPEPARIREKLDLLREFVWHELVKRGLCEVRPGDAGVERKPLAFRAAQLTDAIERAIESSARGGAA